MFDSLPLVRCFSVAIYVITITNMFVSNLQMGQNNLSYAKDEVKKVARPAMIKSKRFSA